MTIYFFDTSALVKRYHEEVGTRQVDAILDDQENEVVISSLLVIESVSAFRRKFNMEEISESELNQLISAFFREALEDFMIVPIEESFLTFSFDLILEEDLRTLDSLQLSTALSLDEEIENLSFVTADRDMAAVAGDRGLETLIPE